MHQLEDILNAASFLSANLSSIDAQQLSEDHRKELQLALDGLKRTLQPRISYDLSSQKIATYRSGNCLQASGIVPSALSQLQQLETSIPSHTETSQPASNTHSVEAPIAPTLPKAVASFMKKLQDHSEEIHSLVSANEKLPDSQINFQTNDWTTEEDPRMVYIALSSKKPTPLERFQGWMSRYSCAEEYRTWAEKKYALTDLLNLSLKDADNKGAGHVAEFLSVHGRQDDRRYRDAIQYGLKCMSFEGIYEDPGVSAVLCLMFTAFREVSYKHLDKLAQAIHNSTEWSEFIKGKAKWISDCQSLHDDRCNRQREWQRSRKRTLEFGEQSQSKRLEPAFIAQGTSYASASSPRIYDPLEWDFRFLLEQEPMSQSNPTPPIL
ncbi:hypothetical protein N7471_010556 [Penicillium samsonianum]|uniref:uncharacterized protein n=1 Tax=Penicillium samsonianum TaxID=1882272 RepID=UPI0025487AC9|nr:uncharacterized protein N7471_010556 [Penicillium samsonianum]KAJ6126063.1 hypothetical protein N7471_010556 [Penicillium samsonianum]